MVSDPIVTVALVLVTVATAERVAWLQLPARQFETLWIVVPTGMPVPMTDWPTFALIKRAETRFNPGQEIVAEFWVMVTLVTVVAW